MLVCYIFNIRLLLYKMVRYMVWSSCLGINVGWGGSESVELHPGGSVHSTFSSNELSVSIKQLTWHIRLFNMKAAFSHLNMKAGFYLYIRWQQALPASSAAHSLLCRRGAKWSLLTFYSGRLLLFEYFSSNTLSKQYPLAPIHSYIFICFNSPVRVQFKRLPLG